MENKLDLLFAWQTVANKIGPGEESHDVFHGRDGTKTIDVPSGTNLVVAVLVQKGPFTSTRGFPRRIDKRRSRMLLPSCASTGSRGKRDGKRTVVACHQTKACQSPTLLQLFSRLE